VAEALMALSEIGLPALRPDSTGRLATDDFEQGGFAGAVASDQTETIPAEPGSSQRSNPISGPLKERERGKSSHRRARRPPLDLG